MSRANPGRVAAVKALAAVEEGAHAEDLLAELAPAKGPDRALAWHLTLGVLRRRGALDSVLAPHVSRGLDRLEPFVRNALRAGLFDCAASRTPPRAAVHQAVEVCKRAGFHRATGLVNAVLRKVSGAALPEDPFLDLPPWLQKRWSQWPQWVGRLGDPAPINIASHRDAPPGVDCVPAVIGDMEVPQLWRLAPGQGAVDALPGFQEGHWWVMDPAAARVADLVAENSPPDGRILDACAAPGGKTFRLSNGQRRIVAVDRESMRLARLKENASRLHMDVDVRQHDWTHGPLAEGETFDAVLVDAPCTGLGTVRRHPEIRWRRLPGDPAAMGIQQAAILRNAAQNVGPGGVLIYAVCSTEPEEGPDVVSQLPGWAVSQTWASAPPIGDEDGFQAFVLRREGSTA